MTGDAASPGLRPIPIDVIEKDDAFEIKVRQLHFFQGTAKSTSRVMTSMSRP